MPRKKLLTKLDVIGALELRPHKVVDEFLVSKQQDAFFVKRPNWDSAGDSINLLYIRNRREYEVMKRQQLELLQSLKRHGKINASRTRKLYKTQAFLRKRFIAINNFIKECAEKKQSAQRQMEDERERHEALTERIQAVESDLNKLSNFQDLLLSEINEYEKYRQIIQDVVDMSTTFDSIKDCVDRCDALMLAQVEIAKLKRKKVVEIDEMRKRMAAVTSEAALRILGMKNELNELERSYQKARKRCQNWEKLLEGAKDEVAYNDLSGERALDGIRSTYLMLCKRQGRDPYIQREEVEEQLDFIMSEMEVLTKVQMILQKEKTRQKVSDAQKGNKCN